MNPAPSRQQVESARLKMLGARQALENHERVKGFTNSSEHKRLSDVFRKAAQRYLKLSSIQR